MSMSWSQILLTRTIQYINLRGKNISFTLLFDQKFTKSSSIVKYYILNMYLFLWCKAEFSASHDLSEINLICLDLLLKDHLLLLMLKTVVLVHSFMETDLYFFRILWI